MPDVPLRLAVAGPAGRLGGAIVKAASARGFELVGGLVRPGSGAVGMDLATFSSGERDVHVAATDDLETAVGNADVLIDVSTATAAAEHAEKLAARGGPAMIIGATGFEPEEDEAIENAAKSIPIVKARNFSIGVSLLAALVEQTAKALDQDWDIEIVEMHHRAKRDAPSGTALMLGEAAAAGRGVELDERAVKAREGMTGARSTGAIGFATLRGGGVVGDHEVRFAASEEMLTLSHRALDRTIFARGALTAARWIKGRAPGLYDMRDVVGL
ncbi:MAG: 4-hydroxy-tetrahydrodipicolinate reductase [Maricaulaceae bacterium]|jgi:4-hydroxy-tetrahydrodipicolinate reductase